MLAELALVDRSAPAAVEPRQRRERILGERAGVWANAPAAATSEHRRRSKRAAEERKTSG